MDAIIFDVDGTLWDSTEEVAISWNQAIAAHTDQQADLTGQSLKHLFGKTMDEIFQFLLPSLPKEEQMRIGYLCYDYENEYLKQHPGRLYPGVREVLEALSKTKELYIVSNCQCGYIELFLEAGQLNPFIKDYLCFGDTLVSKDQTILQLMERHQLKDAVYVGDTQGDFEACEKAGIPFIFAEYGFGQVPSAKVTIQRITDLPACV